MHNLLADDLFLIEIMFGAGALFMILGFAVFVFAAWVNRKELRGVIPLHMWKS